MSTADILIAVLILLVMNEVLNDIRKN